MNNKWKLDEENQDLGKMLSDIESNIKKAILDNQISEIITAVNGEKTTTLGFFKKLYYSIKAWWNSSSIPIELAREELAKIGTAHFSEIKDKKAFLDGAVSYVESLVKQIPATRGSSESAGSAQEEREAKIKEALEAADILVHFSKGYLTSSECLSSKEGRQLARGFVSNLNIAICEIENYENRKKVCELTREIGDKIPDEPNDDLPPAGFFANNPYDRE